MDFRCPTARKERTTMVLCDLPAIRALGLLVVPASIVTWIAYTIGALHRRQLHYWQLRSTYITLVIGSLALLILLVACGFRNDDARLTVLDASAILQASVTVWAGWYNWRRTRSIMLALSVTIIQTVVTWGIVIVFLMRMGSQGTRDSG
jgi:hypothetical protein